MKRALSKKWLWLFVRQFALLLMLALPTGARAADLPGAPANHIYDPDFLMTRDQSSKLSRALTQFQANAGITIYLAIYTAPSQLIDATAADLNQIWNQSGYGVTIAFAPRSGKVSVQPSPELSIHQNADELTRIFREATRPGLARGDYSGAAIDGTAALLLHLNKVRLQLLEAPDEGWKITPAWLLVILAAAILVGAVFLWISARSWRSANLFDRRYRFPAAAGPAALRLGATRSGGLMATSNFREPLKPKDS